MPLTKTPTRLISYYGGKSKCAHLYPAPRFDTIVEPFAGGASYSLRYHERRVHLNDLSDRTCDLWRFILSPDAGEWIERFVPVTVQEGMNILSIFPPGCGAPQGLVQLVCSEAAQGSFGSTGENKIVTAFGALNWNRSFRLRLDYWLPKIRHWTISKNGYNLLPDYRATWFVDPPYNNPAGHRYYRSSVNYSFLADWVKQRKGEVIVCENIGATWLPFETLIMRRRGMETYKDSRTTDGGEAIYYAHQDIKVTDGLSQEG